MNPTSITSLKPTSKTATQFDYFVSIDKLVISTLNAKLDAKVEKSSVEKFKINENMPIWSEGYFKDQKARIELCIPRGPKVYFQTVGTSDRIHTVITNPSHFPSLFDYLEFMERLIPKEVFYQCPIKRIDFSVDFIMPFSKLLKLLDVSFKRITNATAFKGSSINWVNFGKSQSGEFIKAYDKTAFFKAGKEISRIEVQLTTPKLKNTPLHNLAFFNEFIEKRMAQDLFKNIKLRDFTLQSKKSKKPKDRDKLNFLAGALAIVPLSIVRRRLNSNGNFRRDYGAYIDYDNTTIQYWWLIHFGLQQWIEKGSEYER